jgi:hypothetical protein
VTAYVEQGEFPVADREVANFDSHTAAAVFCSAPTWLTMPDQRHPTSRHPLAGNAPARTMSDCLFKRGQAGIAIASTRAIDFIPDKAQCEVLHTTSLVIFVHGGGHRTHS